VPEVTVTPSLRPVRPDDAEAVLYAFDDPEKRLPAIDHLEGFVTGDPASPYRRVLIPARTDHGATVLAWAYVIREARGTHLPGGRWPA